MMAREIRANYAPTLLYEALHRFIDPQERGPRDQIGWTLGELDVAEA